MSGRRRDRLEPRGGVREHRRQIAVDVDERDVEPEPGDPLERLRLAEHDAHLGVPEPRLEPVRPEEDGERHRDCAELGRGDVRDGRLGPLRQDDPDAITEPDTEPPQRVREPVRVVRKLAERDRPGDRAAVGDENRGGVARLALADVDAEVERLRQPPPERATKLLV